jgi:hypothetical protein
MIRSGTRLLHFNFAPQKRGYRNLIVSDDALPLFTFFPNDIHSANFQLWQ